MRSPVQRITWGGVGVASRPGVAGLLGLLAIHRTVSAILVWQLSDRKGGSTMKRSMEPLRCAGLRLG